MTTVQVLDIEISETERHALARLLTKARDTGVQLKRDHLGRYWATSTSQPGTLYAVTAYSCTCKGYQGHQRCKHLAALLSALGWLPEGTDPTPEPVAIAPATCRQCQGMGEIHYERRTGPRSFVGDWMTCPTCSGQPIAA